VPGWEVSIQVDQFEDQFLTDSHEPLGIPFDEETNFFHPEEVQTKNSLLPSRSKSRFTPMIRYACICAKWALFHC